MRSQIMSIRFSEKEKERLEEAAKEMGCPQADVVRWALRRELAEAPKTGPTQNSANSQSEMRKGVAAN